MIPFTGLQSSLIGILLLIVSGGFLHQVGKSSGYEDGRTDERVIWQDRELERAGHYREAQQAVIKWWLERREETQQRVIVLEAQLSEVEAAASEPNERIIRQVVEVPVDGECACDTHDYHALRVRWLEILAAARSGSGLDMSPTGAAGAGDDIVWSVSGDSTWPEFWTDERGSPHVRIRCRANPKDWRVLSVEAPRARPTH